MQTIYFFVSSLVFLLGGAFWSRDSFTNILIKCVLLVLFAVGLLLAIVNLKYGQQVARITDQ